MILYKRQYPVNLLERDAILRIIPAGNRFRRLEEDILNVNERFDFMLINGNLVVVNLDVLERFFRFEEIIRARAEQNISMIEEVNLVEDIAKLRDFATEKRIAKKLMRITSDSPVLSVSKQRILDFVSSHPKLKRSIRLNEDKTKIRLDTKVSMELFVKLLDDDYLKSELTDLQYEAISKDRISEE